MSDPLDAHDHIDIIRSRLGPGQRIAFISGDFNVVHPGHLRIINFARSCADFLVVGVLADGMGNTLVPQDLRCNGVSAIGVVGYSFILTVPPAEFIAALKPDVVVKGREYSRRINQEQAAVETYGGKLLFDSGDSSFSSLELLRRDLYQTNFSSIKMPGDFPRRHGFTVADLTRVVDGFSGLRLVVIGDLIVDEYVSCEALGMSREDPTLVVSPILSEKFVGGAGIVAAHAAGMGADVSYFCVAADDDAARFARDKLDGYGVTSVMLSDETRPTTLKQRFRAGNKTLLRVSHLRQHDISDTLIDALFDKMTAALETAQLVIFSDFNYGCLPQALVDRVRAFCAERGTPMVADSQASSQIGDVSRFKGMTLLTPTEYEARLAVRDFQSGLVVLAETLRQRADAQFIVLTLGSEGVVIHRRDRAQGIFTDELPAFNRSPRDVSGAGDCLLTCTAMALVAGANIWQSVYLGSIAAACQVSRIGNLPLTKAELVRELTN